jgi:hypothetical protein
MRITLPTLAVTLGLAFVGTAHAQDWKAIGQFGYFGVGKSYEIEKGHMYWTGEFSGTFFNDKGKDGLFDHAGIKCPAINDLDMNNKKGKAAGYCIITDAAGDRAYSSWNCVGDTVNCKGTFEYTGGTGKYEKIAGSNTFSAMTAVRWNDGTASGFATWNR